MAHEYVVKADPCPHSQPIWRLQCEVAAMLPDEACQAAEQGHAADNAV